MNILRGPGWVLVLLIVLAGLTVVYLSRENNALRQQLEQAKANAGKPIKVSDLPEGYYDRQDDSKVAAIVLRSINKSGGGRSEVYAVYCDKWWEGGIPASFSTSEVDEETNSFKH